MLMTREQAAQKIQSGATLYLAGDQALLDSLPKGNWIGGTIPYFMDKQGGTHSRELIFVSEQDPCVSGSSVRWYDVGELPSIASDSPDHGFSVIILPATSQAHVRYAQDSPDYPGLFMKNIVGWVSGVDLADLGKLAPRIYDGTSGKSYSEGCVALHATLPEDKMVSVGIVNCFEQGDGDVITFAQDGFDVGQALVNGEPRDFAEYLTANQIDVRLPLVADYNGEKINASIQSIDQDGRKVTLYAPVFRGVEYRIAAPVANYVEEFSRQLPQTVSSPEFSCNCILNFLYSELEGKRTGELIGPVTFGEVAYQLLNQTMVYLQIEDMPT
ncbi:hypothetical protein JR064_08385 [Xanthomonas sp. CFBP 8703]|uniref:Uncharacterized protein n=1 Tax=Xanthomonas bonasiae TaxID=2810351 RepID=A0ABS3B0R7_9XANT|nr:hypothetical protein [Xanthomonas bonasiae]MBN6102177.1 hypothetical protein [Xanthomonas bonasiae]MBN6110334.1 hypothetical protein [Xanthomonas bonasiae]